VEMLLVARSIGRRLRAEALSSQGHAALVFDLGRAPRSEHWLAQGGPVNGVLSGSVIQCPSAGWHSTFSQARGAIWQDGSTDTLPVFVLLRKSLPQVDRGRLISLAERINNRRLRYAYNPGPNSNTYVRLLLEALGQSTSLPNASALELLGWNWR
jgi:hypothetical protein